MATSRRTVTIVFVGPPAGTQALEAADNEASPCSITIQALSSGFNSISVPASTGVTVTAVTIVPPTGNTATITLKGLTGDTGISLHPTDPTTIGLASSVTAIGLTAGSTIQGVRFYWS